MVVESSLRVREAQDIFNLVRESPEDEQGHFFNLDSGPPIVPTFGPHDGKATFRLQDPGQLPDVVCWLYREIAEGRLTRSVTTVQAGR